MRTLRYHAAAGGPATNEQGCGIDFGGGQCLSLADYVRVLAATLAASAAAAC